MPDPIYPSLSISDIRAPNLNMGQRAALGLILFSIISLIIGSLWPALPVLWVTLFITCISAGSLLYTFSQYKDSHPGIKNNAVYHRSISNKGFYGWGLGIFLTTFYIVLYWFPGLLGYSETDNTGLIALFDPISFFLKGKAASQWFMYGFLYSLAILLLGIKFIAKYRHSKYQVLRTSSVIFFQLGFAFIIPELLQRLNMPYYDPKNMWPLNYYFFDEWNINALLSSGNIGVWMIIWGIAMIVIVSPILTYFYGKRWYCSWVCGCGGLAETAGDSFRHLSDKSLKAWKLERWMVHSVLVLVTITTLGVIYTYLPEDPKVYWINRISFLWMILISAVIATIILIFKRNKWFSQYQKTAFLIACGVLALIIIWSTLSIYYKDINTFPIDPYILRSWYGFYIGALFSGVIGVGFYPIFGNRVWCRFGCPMAAILGLQQKWFSRFRITTNGGQCISCGNCSTYCEMGIDVKSYAQRGQDIIRASCVGCGICSSVCPRGVLKLENGPLNSKQNSNYSLFNEDYDILK